MIPTIMVAYQRNNALGKNLYSSPAVRLGLTQIILLMFAGLVSGCSPADEGVRFLQSQNSDYCLSLGGAPTFVLQRTSLVEYTFTTDCVFPPVVDGGES